MSFQLTLKLNNQIVTNHLSSVRILNGYPTLSWEFDTINKVSIDGSTGITSDVGELTQVSYEIEIGTLDYNIGSVLFAGQVSRTGVVASKELFWSFRGVPLQRGVTYYGQVRATDELNRTTEFSTF